jgi:uncharacterized protein
MMRTRHGILLTCIALALCGCGSIGCSRENAPIHATISDVFPLSIGGVEIKVQVAITEPEQEKGLMYRSELADNVGMIFIYKTPQKMSYWMKNVPIPLSIGFIKADGTLAEIRFMLPNDTRAVFSSGSDIKFALEMNEGWFERHGVKAGAKIDLARLAQALESRGEESAGYGL